MPEQPNSNPTDGHGDTDDPITVAVMATIAGGAPPGCVTPRTARR